MLFIIINTLVLILLCVLLLTIIDWMIVMIVPYCYHEMIYITMSVVYGILFIVFFGDIIGFFLR